MSFTHIVTFKWKDADFIDAPVAEALQQLVVTFDGVERYLCGPDVGFTPGAYDFAVVGTFTTREHFVQYRDHPEHKRIIADMIAPYIDTRTSVQLEH